MDTLSVVLTPWLHLTPPVSVNSRKDKSLRVMSQKFVMLFLVSEPHVVSLEVAAKILIGEDPAADQDKNKFKSEFIGDPIMTRNANIQYVKDISSCCGLGCMSLHLIVLCRHSVACYPCCLCCMLMLAHVSVNIVTVPTDILLFLFCLDKSCPKCKCVLNINKYLGVVPSYCEL